MIAVPISLGHSNEEVVDLIEEKTGKRHTTRWVNRRLAELRQEIEAQA